MNNNDIEFRATIIVVSLVVIAVVICILTVGK